MVEMTTEVQIPASPSRVWAILTDFPGYSTWISFLRIEGHAALDERLTYVFASDQAGVRWRSFPALIVTFEPAREIGWAAGMPYLLKIEERFQISITQREALSATRLGCPASPPWRSVASAYSDGSYRFWRVSTGRWRRRPRGRGRGGAHDAARLTTRAGRRSRRRANPLPPQGSRGQPTEAGRGPWTDVPANSEVRAGNQSSQRIQALPLASTANDGLC